MILRAVAFVLASSLATPALANGVISEFPAGGVVFKQAANIAIAREDLYLSPRLVRVHYVYRSDSAETETHTIGFPMPRVPLGDVPDYLGGADVGGLPDMRNYMNLQVKVGDREVETTLHEFAWLEGANVTEQLKATGLPLLLTEEGKLDAFASVDRAVLDELVEQGFFEAYDDLAYWQPTWEYQSVFEWQQDFAPGLTEVEITYVPLNGYPGDFGGTYEGGGEYDDPQTVAETNAWYCIDDVLIRAIKRRGGYELVTQGYVTTSGNFWKGPIEEFNLTVDKHDSAPDMQAFDLVAFCPLDAEKISETQFRWSARNYEPERDIGVVYYSFY